MNYYLNSMDSPVGKLSLIANEKNLLAVLWEGETLARFKASHAEIKTESPILLEAKKQLREYFAGERKAFTLNLEMIGTDFQKKVWQGLLTIPYGTSTSYGVLAAQVGNPKGARAIGLANGKNPLSIVVPCHRVIGKNGHLTGFGGGMDNKAFLLNLEKKYV